MKKKDKYITPIRHFIDENDNWMIEFNKEDINKLMKKFKVKKKKKHLPLDHKYRRTNFLSQ